MGEQQSFRKILESFLETPMETPAPRNDFSREKTPFPNTEAAFAYDFTLTRPTTNTSQGLRNYGVKPRQNLRSRFARPAKINQPVRRLFCGELTISEQTALKSLLNVALLPLNIEETQIRSRYRQQAFALHPDRSADDGSAFRQLQLDYEIIKMALNRQTKAAA